MDPESHQLPPMSGSPAEIAPPSIHGARRRGSQSSIGAPKIRVKKPSPNRVRNPAASPEVISSLIDSLSSISHTAQNHFENLSPASPGLQSQFGKESPTPPDDDSIHRSGYYRTSSQSDGGSDHADDACEPPVIRTSKPPSGYSPITAPKKKDRDHSLKGYMSRGGGSSVSLHSAHSGQSASSFGNVSIEPGILRKVSDGSNSTSSESKRSARGHKGLMYMSSRERLRSREVERKRATVHGLEASAPGEVARQPVPQLYVSEDTINEEPVVAESSRATQRHISRNASPLRNRLNLSNSPDRGSLTDQGLIPQRASSLKHSVGLSQQGKRSQGEMGSGHDSHSTNAVPEEEEAAKVNSADPGESAQDKILHELEQEENEVARRIRELREQKMLRDRLAGKLPAGVAAGAPPNVARVSPVDAARPSPTSTVSNSSEPPMLFPAKAHRVLGIAMSPTTSERRISQGTESQEIRETRETVKDEPDSHTGTRSLLMNDEDRDEEEMTPLPINYTLALQALECTSPTFPAPSSSSAASSRGTAPIKSPSSRPKSFAVGGRSAIGRRATSSMVMKSPTAHQLSPSTTSDGSSDRMFRSASEEITHRQRSLHTTSPSPTPLGLQHRPTLKKKRWSHPDLPAKAERRHNRYVDAMNAAAVQPPPHPVIEERPTTADSIAIEIEDYLDSPRLSQKIRHPQTGRVISFSEVGDPNGFAVFVCVGMGLTRYVMAFYDQLASTLKLRLITPDRPSIGASQPDPNGTPLSWPDDVLVICQALKITKFSLLAHSAGAVYALATSLRMPQHIRGRVHLLAPWIPPSQMAPIGVSRDSPPAQQLPRSQRILRALPPSLLRVANSSFLGATSASLTGPKGSPKTKRRSTNPQAVPQQPQQPTRPPLKDVRRESLMLMDQVLPNTSQLSLANPADPNRDRLKQMKEALTSAERQRQREYDERLTFAIWDRATANANPASDLIVCLETKQPIGFRYEDINRAVVIHHGSKDSRVPVDNVRWLGRLMRKCEVRILEGEQHGLMASAQVMGNVLMEMATDWEDWTAVVHGKMNAERTITKRRTLDRMRSIT